MLYRYSSSFTASGEALVVTGFFANPVEVFSLAGWFASVFGFCGSAAKAQNEKEVIMINNLKPTRLKVIIPVSFNCSLKKVLLR
jgi:hypothetical protein